MRQISGAGGFNHKRPALFYGILIGLPFILFLFAFMVGRFPVSPWAVLKILASSFFLVDADEPKVVYSVVLDVRLPRIVAAMLAGGALALSGACYQGVFRNPLVSPFSLGVSSGAGFGAAVAILFFTYNWMVPVSAFLFALLSVFFCFAINRLYRSNSTLVLILGGIIVGSLFMALLALLKYVADPFSKLPIIEFWLLGSLASVSKDSVWVVSALIIPAAFLLFLLRWRLNILAMGDDTARQLGMNPAHNRFVYILAATLIAAAAVSISGIIGWVGLVVPHLARIVVGPDFRRLIPASFSFGACYLLVIDTVSRTLTAAEIPLGILTALVGAPLFLMLLRRNRLGWVL